MKKEFKFEFADMAIAEAMKLLEEKAAVQYDLLVNSDQVECRYDDDAGIQYGVRRRDSKALEVVQMNPLALTQMFRRTGLAQRTYEKFDDLKPQLFNRFVQNDSKPIRLRMRKGKERDVIRAFLTKGYTAIDDVSLFPLVFKHLPKDYSIKMLQIDEGITRCVIKVPGHSAEIGSDEYSAGIVITNSEVGLSSIWIEPAVVLNKHLLVNRNAMSRGINKEYENRIVHRGTIEDIRISTILDKALEAAQVGIVSVGKLNTVELDKKETEAFVKKEGFLGNAIRDAVLDLVEEEERISKLRLLKIILQQVRSLPLFERSIIEQKVGSRIGLFSHYEEEMAELLQEMNQTGVTSGVDGQDVSNTEEPVLSDGNVSA